MQKTINELTDIELKAIKSDLYETVAKCQNDLQVINQELTNRSKREIEVDEAGVPEVEAPKEEKEK